MFVLKWRHNRVFWSNYVDSTSFSIFYQTKSMWRNVPEILRVFIRAAKNWHFETHVVCSQVRAPSCAERATQEAILIGSYMWDILARPTAQRTSGTQRTGAVVKTWKSTSRTLREKGTKHLWDWTLDAHAQNNQSHMMSGSCARSARHREGPLVLSIIVRIIPFFPVVLR